MAGAGTWGAGGAFLAREVLLEQLCWLDGGCERVRRGYLYGQLCCVGGCGREGVRSGGKGGELLPKPGEGGGAHPRCSPAPILCSGNTWEEGGLTCPRPQSIPPLEKGEVGGASWQGFGLGFWAPGSWQPGLNGGGGEEGGPAAAVGLCWGFPSLTCLHSLWDLQPEFSHLFLQ